MSISTPDTEQPRFVFLMPVWGDTYIEYLLTYGLPTLLAPGNIPSLPNLAVSQFTFITRSEDEAKIRASTLFARLDALVPIKFIFLDFYQSDREEKFNQLGMALKLGANEALGNGFCLFLHPDGLYSDGMMKHLYGVARSGKRACVSHGPNASIEKVRPYLEERGLLKFDEVNPLAPRALAGVLMDNLHPDTLVHCMGHPHYPLEPYMGFWLAPKQDGALFRFISLHPWLVDLSHLSEIIDFTAIDHNFIRAHGFIWSDVHVETDSDNFLVIGLKPENECNAVPNRLFTHQPHKFLTRSLRRGSNCNYSRFCFFQGLRVHTGDMDREWHDFEVANLKWLNDINDASMVMLSVSLFHSQSNKLVVVDKCSLIRPETYRYWWSRLGYYSKKTYDLAVRERSPVRAFLEWRDLFSRLFLRIKRSVFGLGPAEPGSSFPRHCAVCKTDQHRCVSGDMRSKV